MDAFFAAVEERARPRLRGLPIAVGADPKGGAGRGIVSTANYKAREYGIRSALPISTAWRYSEEAKRAGKPEVIFIEPDFKKYSAASDRIMEIIKKAIHKKVLLERASVDEAYFDLSFTNAYEAAQKLCETIKKEIKKEENLTCSIGIGPNKLIAKIASDMKKPDGLTVVEEKDAENFLEPLPIRKIPGIGPKTEEKFKKLSAGGGSSSGGKVARVADLKKFSEEKLRELLGVWGAELYRKIRGIDDSPIVEEYEAKSIGEQETFEIDSRDPGFISARLKALSDGVFRSFKQSGFKVFSTIVVTVRFADFVTKSRSHTMPDPTDSKIILEFEAFKLLMPFFDKRENQEKKAIRLIGIRVEKLN